MSARTRAALGLTPTLGGDAGWPGTQWDWVCRGPCSLTRQLLSVSQKLFPSDFNDRPIWFLMEAHPRRFRRNTQPASGFMAPHKFARTSFSLLRCLPISEYGEEAGRRAGGHCPAGAGTRLRFLVGVTQHGCRLHAHKPKYVSSVHVTICTVT